MFVIIACAPRTKSRINFSLWNSHLPFRETYIEAWEKQLGYPYVCLEGDQWEIGVVNLFQPVSSPCNSHSAGGSSHAIPGPEGLRRQVKTGPELHQSRYFTSMLMCVVHLQTAYPCSICIMPNVGKQLKWYMAGVLASQVLRSNLGQTPNAHNVTERKQFYNISRTEWVLGAQRRLFDDGLPTSQGRISNLYSTSHWNDSQQPRVTPHTNHYKPANQLLNYAVILNAKRFAVSFFKVLSVTQSGCFINRSLL